MNLHYFKSLLILILLMSGMASAQTTVPGYVTGNQTWTPAGSPYLITQTTYIDTHATVKILPGTVIKANGNRLYVNGEFQATGNASSVIVFDSLEINYNNGSRDYDDSTLSGAYFKYCYFKGLGSGRHTIRATGTSIRLDYCTFRNSYYSLYFTSTSPAAHAIVEHCDMEGDAYGSGSPIYVSGSNLSLHIEDNDFHDAYQMFLGGKFDLLNNRFKKVKSVLAYLSADCRISCNYFLHMTNGLEANINSYGKPIDIIITHNTFDSSGGQYNGTTLYYPMLKLTRNSSAYLYKTLQVNYNNFLYCHNYNDKVLISGSNPAPSRSDTLNFNHNYWGTTSATAISNMVKDYKDEVAIWGTADWSNYLTSKDTSCNKITTSCPNTIDFAYTSNAKTISLQNTSTGGTNYRIHWNFGDGNVDSSSAQSITYTYGEAGSYSVCISIYDAYGQYCGSKCDTIDLSSDTGCQADFYLAIDTTKSFNLFIINSSKGITSNTQFYWSFGDGTGSNQRNPTHTYNAFGLYKLCLTIYDSATACNSTYCDSIGLDSLGKLLKKGGFTIQVLDETELSVQDKKKISESISAYPNPVNHTLQVDLTRWTRSNATVILMNHLGQTVYQSVDVSVSDQRVINIDVSGYTSGIYYLQVNSEGKSETIKLIKL